MSVATDTTPVAVVPARWQARPTALTAAAGAVALVLAAPLVFLLLEARDAGAGTIWGLIFRSLTATLLWNTVRLTVVVTFACAVLGTGAAWLIERTDLPGRRLFSVLVVVPLAIPDFVISFGWSSLSDWVQGFRGAVLVMSLAVYPLVYLPVAAALRSADPGQEEVARSLGLGRLATFWRVTLRQARGAIFGGCLLVAMVLLAEYGAFEILGYQTFTTEIFTEFSISFNIAAACALSLVLVALSVVLLGVEAAAQRGRREDRSGALAARVIVRHRLGHWRWPALASLIALCAGALGVPVYSAIHWIVRSHQAYLAGSSLADAAWHTALYSGFAAALATLMALPVALAAIRRRSRAARLLERSTYLVLALPGLVIALALSHFAERDAGGFWYQSPQLLVLAYAILFFPLALVGVRASLIQAPVALEEVARSLGVGRLAVLVRVTLPLIAPGLAASFCLVFLSGVTELTATLILVPTGVQTLATQFWAYQQNLAYGQAAPFALAIIAIAALPSALLARFFDRLPGRAGVAR